jgi:hypothetical protein
MAKQFLSAADIDELQNLRAEMLSSIKGTRLSEVMKNYLQLEANTWLDARAQILYKEGVELPAVAPAEEPPA